MAENGSGRSIHVMVGEGGCNFFPSVCADVGTDNQICRRRAAWRHNCFSMEHILGILLPNICWETQQKEKDYNLEGSASTPSSAAASQGVDGRPAPAMTGGTVCADLSELRAPGMSWRP